MPGGWISVPSAGNRNDSGTKGRDFSSAEVVRAGPIDGKNDLRVCGNADGLYRMRAESGIETVRGMIGGGGREVDR